MLLVDETAELMKLIPAELGPYRPLTDIFSRSGPGACRGSAAGEWLIYLRLKHKARKLAGLDHWSCANIKDDMCMHTQRQTCKASLQLADGGLDEDEFMMRLNWQQLISPTRLLNRKRRKSGWTCGCKPVWLDLRSSVMLQPLNICSNMKQLCVIIL